MGKFIDLTGRRFGRLIVIKVADSNKYGKYKWLCKCNCGNEKVVRGGDLRSGDTQSCGCLQKEVPPYNFIDLAGQSFGKLVVIERAENKGKTVRWLCKCDCGNETIVARGSLRGGDTKSCGCLRHEGLPEGEASFNKLYGSYKRKAEDRGYDFKIDKKLFSKLTKENCFYCNTKPATILKNKHNKGNYIYNGIDRVDNKIGYEIGNIVTCCETCNRAKLVMSKQEFLSWVEKVYNHSIKNKKETNDRK